MKRLPHDSLAQARFFQKKEPVPPKACPRPVVPEEAARRHRYLRPLGRSVAVSGDYRGVDHPPAQRAFAVFRAEGCGSGRGKRCGRRRRGASGSLVILISVGFVFVRYDAGHFRPDESQEFEFSSPGFGG